MRQIHQNRNILFLIFVPLVFIVIFFLVPLFFVLIESFYNKAGFLTLSRYINFFTDSRNLFIYWRTLKLGLIVTLFAVILGYPTAYVIANAKTGRRSLLMSIVILPLMTSPVARTYAWLIILGRFGLINQSLEAMKLIKTPLRLIYTENAIVIGLLQLFLPLMILSLVSAMENIPDDLEEAARSLGAGWLKGILVIIFPLSMDGLILGATLVFTGSITAYVTPAILGGTSVLTLSTLLYQKSLVLMDWEGATIVAVIMVLTTLILYILLRKLRPKLI